MSAQPQDDDDYDVIEDAYADLGGKLNPHPTARRTSRKGRPAPRNLEPVPVPVTPAISTEQEVLAYYAELVNSGRYVPQNAFSNLIRDGLLHFKLVTPERLRQLGIY